MNNTIEILAYIESIANSQLSGSALLDINNKIKHTRTKMCDSKLYLALVGEFSSGKSTFINALIGFRLLKEAVMPTTACATYIQSGGAVLAVNVTFFDNKKFIVTSDNYRTLAEYLMQRFYKSFSSLQEIIETITSDQVVAKTVKNLYLTIPNAKIPKNIVLIDTPGFNPGAVSIDNHYEITKYVVEQVADAALILTPQEQAMSATLSRFLNETLSRCLHRCLFVITKMDNLPIEHRTSTIAYTRQRIISDLNVSTPNLYAESAITMLPVKRIPIDKQDDWMYFQNEFKKFETAIWENLQTKNKIVLTEHINTLVKEIVVLCSQRINEKQSTIKADKQFLEDHGIESIQTVCNKMVSNSSNAINTTLSSLSISFYSAKNNSKRRAESIIDEGLMSISRFKNDMMPSIRCAVEDEAKKQLSSISISLNKAVKQCVSSEITKMQQVFTSHYDSFPTLRPQESSPKTDLIRLNTPNLTFSIAISKIEALEKEENKVIGGGAAGGAGFGFLLGGPVGALIGAGLGAILGAGAGDKSDEMRASVKPVVKNEIDSFFSSLGIKVDNEINRVKQRYIKLIKEFADDHIKQYGQAVDQLIMQHREKIKFLNKQIVSLKSTINNLGNIQDDIEQELAILKVKQ